VGTIRAAQLLSRTYTLVATNVPYLYRGSHNEVLRQFADATYPEAKNDLATLFLERCLQFVAASDDARGNPVGAGTVAAVTPQNWLFLGKYKALRMVLLERDSFELIARLGARAFRTISGEVVNVILVVLTAEVPATDHAFVGIDVSTDPDTDTKSLSLKSGDINNVSQNSQQRNPHQRIILEVLADDPSLSEYANAWQGVKTSDDPRFVRNFWEMNGHKGGWRLFQSTGDSSSPYSGLDRILLFEDGYGALTEICQKGAQFRGASAWGKTGVAVSTVGRLGRV
jgi:hypothetical protein